MSVATLRREVAQLRKTLALQRTPTPKPIDQPEMDRRTNARNSLEHFTRYMMPTYQVKWFHRVWCQYLDKLVSGEIRRLLVLSPPRHGKSTLVSRYLPAYVLGRDPNAQIIACSYSADLASRMNRDVQRIIDDSRFA